MRIKQTEHYNTKSFLQDLIKRGLWLTKDRGIIRIDEMSESHIKNVEKKFGIKLKG